MVFENRNPAWTRAQAASGSLTIILDDGSSVMHAIPQALGHPCRPLSDQDLIGKFIGCAAYANIAVAPEKAKLMADLILSGSSDIPAYQIM